MTEEKAIDLLNNLIGMIEDNHNSNYDLALKMGIKALQQRYFFNKRKDDCQKRVMCQGCRFYCPYIGCALKWERSKNV